MNTLPDWLEHWTDIGFLDDLDRAFAQLLKRTLPEISDTVLTLAALVSRQWRHGHSCLPLDKTAPTDFDIANTAFTPAHWWHRSDAAGKLAALQQGAQAASALSNDNTPLMYHRNRLYLRRAWHAEQQVAAGIQQKLQQQYPVPETSTAALSLLFPSPLPVTDWQKVACALSLRCGFTLITGGPGTGKTTTVVRLLALLQWNRLAQENNARKLRILLAAPTGKAAARLKESISKAIDTLPVSDELKNAIPHDVLTLHKLLGTRPQSRHFIHHADNPLHADVVVVDEASMLDLEMAAALFAALPPDCRLILLGDKDQLASVEAGAVMGELCANAEHAHYHPATLTYLQSLSGEIISTDHPDDHDNGHPHQPLAQQTVMLRYSHRFAGNSDIKALSDIVNRGQQADEALFRHSTTLQWISQDTDDLRRAVVEGYRHYLNTLQDILKAPDANPDGHPDANAETCARQVLANHRHFQVLCALREGEQGVTGLNQRIRQWLAEAGLVDGHGLWYAGRPVMITRNDYGSGLMNGDIGITLPVPGAEGSVKLRVAFLTPDNRVQWLLPSRLEHAETVFAMTVHKSQGSEFDQVLMVMPKTDTPILTRELVYTAITRARQRFILCSSHPSLAVLPRTRRDSGLQSLLQTSSTITG